MSLFRAGSLWLFRFVGIDVYVHWSWLIVAIFQVQGRAQAAREGDWFLPLYDSGKWYALQYLTLFGIVLLHEFGHALACRQVGGLADTIVLWPLGGIAFVKPPQRPGAFLWTAAAGPLVNVLLVPLLSILVFVDLGIDWNVLSPDLPYFLRAVWTLNLGLLIFNLIPVYPLDGGQILHGILWYLIGRAESLMVVSILGMFIGGTAMILALVSANLWMCILSAFVFFTAGTGLRQGRMLARLLGSPRRTDAACPSCKTAPLLGDYWVCDECSTHFDTFQCRAQCPGCGKLFRATTCPNCGKEHLIGEWFAVPTPHGDSPDFTPR